LSIEFSNYRLGDIADVQTGPFGSQLHQKDYVDNGTPIITVEHLLDNRISHVNTPYVSDEDKERLSKYKLVKGDIVFSRVGSVDRRAYVREEENGWLFSGRCLRVRVKNREVSSLYLSYYFGLESFKAYIRRIAVGATMPSINTQILSDIEVKVPAINVQHKIEDILNSIDEKIELNKKINQTLEEMAMTLYKHWFVDFGPFQLGEFTETELGMIPKSWGVAKLKDVAVVNKHNIKSDYPYKNIRYVDISSVFEGKLGGYSNYSLSDAPSRAKRLVNDGDVIWSTVRPNRKSFLYIYKPFANTVVSTGFAVLSPVKIPSTFLYLHVITEQFVSYLVNNAKGSAYPAVNASTFKDAKIVWPPKNVLENFNDKVFPLINLKNENEIENVNLKQTRDYLLPKLLSGEIDLYKANEIIKNVSH
jgi:type I restriction enzyme, S subunit